jgi:3-dehydroquinate synthase
MGSAEELTAPKANRVSAVKFTLFVLLVVALVSVPFVIWGESFAFPLLEEREHQAGWLVLIAIALLTADAVAPVPSVLVIVFLAAKAGWLAGVVGGTLGLSGGVIGAAWFGRAAVGRIAPKFFPDAELGRLRAALHEKLWVTLACLRSVPVLAETSVMVAASVGIPLRRIFWVTLLPNFAISAIYSLAADDSLGTAVLAFFATVVPSYALWRWLGGRERNETV